MRGTERLAWAQPDHRTGLRFRAYVDNTPFQLDAATCDGAPEPTCSSPLPPMADGVHTITLVSVLGTGLESAHSEPVVVQKVSGAPSSMPPAGGATTRSGALALDATLQVTPDLALAADVVVRGIRGPAQMAATPDGRLLIAEGDGSVSVARPGVTSRMTRALGPEQISRMLAVAPSGSLGLATDPDFAQNQFVYLAAIVESGSGRYLRVFRLREVRDTLGDPASLFEASVVGDASEADARFDRTAVADGPRLGFGPDGLLYVALPAGVTFDREPLASRPHASMVRLRRDGLIPDATPFTGVRGHPQAFTWDPSNGALWLAFAEDGTTTVEQVTTGREPAMRTRAESTRASERLRLSTMFRVPPAARALAVGNISRLQMHRLTQNLVRMRGASTTVRLAMPMAAGNLAGALGDLVSTADGTWFAMTANAGEEGEVVVRLKTVD